LLLARIGAGMRQVDAARLAGISQFWLSECERGNGNPSEALVTRLLDLYGGDS
jgi:predicted transcriptional regulator